MNAYLPKDSVMLLSVVNTKLRDEYENLSQLCEELDISEDELCHALAQIDYQYDAGTNQFK